MRKSTLGPCTKLLVILTVVTLLAGVASANVSGAIFTSTKDGTTVNGNLYDAKTDVYLNGGPQNGHDPGLVPDGQYYFMVTDPSGAVLLSHDTNDVTTNRGIECREVQVTGGRIVGAIGSCPHANGTPNPSNGQTPVQLFPYDDTPNNGGEYKAWLTPIANYSPDPTKPNCSSPSNIKFGFCDADSKTNTFKVRKADVGFVTVCKFNDENADGVQDNFIDPITGLSVPEPLIPFWPIKADGVDTLSGPIGTVNAQTDLNGCVSFSVSDFTTAGGVVTLTEGFLIGNWQQTAPPDGTYTVPDGNPNNTNGTVTVTVLKGIETLTLAAGDSVAAPNFGNTCLDDTCGGNKVELTVTKDANPSFTRTFTWGITKTVDNTTVHSAGGGDSTPANYTVSVTHDAGTDSGWQVTGTIKVSNPSLIDITGVNVTDAVDNGGTCTITFGPNGDGTGIDVPAKSFVDVPYTCTYSASPAPGTNKAKASWDSTSASGTASIDFSGAAIHVVDGSVTVTDTLDGSLGTVSSTDASPTTFTYSKTFNDPAGTCTSHDNTATFTTSDTQTTGSAKQTVTDCQGADLIVSKTATAAFKSTITKDVDKTLIDTSSGTNVTFTYTVKVATSNWTVNGTITVQNPNDWEPITASLADTLTDAGGGCTVNGGNTTVTVAASGSVTVPYSCSFGSVPSASSGTNTATATWDKTAASTPTGSASGNAGYSFGSLTVTDTFNGATNTLGPVTIPPGSATFTYQRTVTAPTGTCKSFTNTATITETGQTAQQTVTVCGASDLTVSKTAAAAYTSVITKSVDKTKVEQAGGTVTFNYTVKVTTSGWNVKGGITVTNPNDWEDITANVGDSLSDSGGSCTVTGGASVFVSRSSSVSLPYTCTFSAVPSVSGGINTGTATWKASTYFTPDGSASGTASYAFSSLTITDCFGAKGQSCTTTTLGTLTIPPGLATFTYAHTVPNALGGTCQEYDNTATITQTGQTANAAVTVCNTKTGALTMGFWQNKNGQGIITGGGSTGGVCNSGTWLRQYAPFLDLSPTASCSAVATYVFNLIKAANAGGASMNAMLKAQMLATALDVYFSDPALGGNKIGAAQPLGGVKIDLTKVCIMIDNTNGTGTCSGGTESTSAAFGGATSGTVSSLLSYAASQSNPGGSIWYGQVKATQGLAKNTFDAINNQAAFIAP